MAIYSINGIISNRQKQKGQSLVESSLTVLPFMLFILCLIDTSITLWVRSTMEHAVREGARYAITYRTESGLRHDASIKQVVARNSMGMLSPSDITIQYYDGNTESANLLRPTAANTGNSPDNIVVITAQRNWFWIMRSLMRGRTVTLTASSADRMESLGSGQTPPLRF